MPNAHEFPDPFPFSARGRIRPPTKGTPLRDGLTDPRPAPAPPRRLRVIIRGAVQGVGFRPFVYRLARELALAGWVLNSAQGVFLEVEGPPAALEQFLLRVRAEKPPRAFIQSLEPAFLDPAGFAGFEIRHSAGGAKTALVLPDVATCPDCLAEILDPADRRHRYPFTNCTNCGPRYSIIEALPYDRAATTMRRFTMCPACRAEYEDPENRRFHAQPNACPACGPRLELWDAAGQTLAAHDDALRRAGAALREGAIVAVKGLGGFHLMADALNANAVAELRRRKRREEKPFALMVPSLAWARRLAAVSPLEELALTSPESPIVLLQALHSENPQSAIAPGNPYLGLMLPYTPLHHLLLRDLDAPLVATSGNLSDEPICIDEREALRRLAGIADLFLVHDRPIARHVDDSIVRVVAGREQVMRRARGYAPLPIPVAEELPPILAVGAHLKNAVALALGRQVFVSQHIGDLETREAGEAFERVIASIGGLYDFRPEAVACDLHPDYLSTQFARRSGLPVIPVQHHYAHALACLAENELHGEALAVAWDGTGLGEDRTIWGGEFLLITEGGFERAGWLRPFPLPGGDKAAKEPRRSALGLLYEMQGEAPAIEQTALAGAFAPAELAPLRQMLARGLNTPRTSSAGRLFDAAAALAGLRQVTRFEGQSAMALEFALAGETLEEAYPFALREAPEGGAILDWAPAIQKLLNDTAINISVGIRAARFHNTLVEMIVTMAHRMSRPAVLLTGGCFQNRYLLERSVQRLTAEGFRPYWHQRIPPGDGGIALGQALAAARVMRKRS